MSAALLQLDQVSTVFRQGWGRGRSELIAMRDVSFEVHAGETLGLVGESGSGKTTTAQVALGLQQPTFGSVRFLGEPMKIGKRGRSRKGLIQTVPQSPLSALDPRLRVGLSIAEPLAARDRSRLSSHVDEVAELMRQVRLDPGLADRYPHELSGGQRQRIVIARALITNPRFIVFDEAVSALDVSVQAQTLNLISDLQKKHGFGALFISHDMAAVRYVAHRVAVMRLGEIVEVADVGQFYRTPTHEYSRQLLDAL